MLQGLSPCSMYWVVVTAINCGLRVTSDAHILGLYESTPFNVTFCLEQSVACTDWIAVDVINKLNDVESFLNSAFTAQCPASNRPCYRDSEFSCSTDNRMVIFE